MREAALFCTEPQFSSNTSTCTMTAKLEVEFIFSLLDAQRTCSVSLCVIRRNALSDFFCFSSRLFFFVAGGAQYSYVESYGVIGFITGNI